MHATFLVHLILLQLFNIIIFGEASRLLSPSLCSLLQPRATSFLLSPYIVHSTLFSNTINVCSSFSVTDQDSHPYKITDKSTVRYILMLHPALPRFCYSCYAFVLKSLTLFDIDVIISFFFLNRPLLTCGVEGFLLVNLLDNW
jgi:hypothetical protein